MYLCLFFSFTKSFSLLCPLYLSLRFKIMLLGKALIPQEFQIHLKNVHKRYIYNFKSKIATRSQITLIIDNMYYLYFLLSNVLYNILDNSNLIK